MAKKLTLLLLILLLLLAVLPIHAQADFYIESDVELNVDAIRESVQPLLDRGADVAVHIVQSGSTEAHDQFLEENNLKVLSNVIDRDLIAILISLDEQTIEVLFGNKWRRALDSREEEIISTYLAPNMQEGAYNDAIILTLAAIERAIAEAPTPTPYLTPVPTTSSTPSTALDSDSASSNTTLYIFLMGVIIVYVFGLIRTINRLNDGVEPDMFDAIVIIILIPFSFFSPGIDRLIRGNSKQKKDN